MFDEQLARIVALRRQLTEFMHGELDRTRGTAEEAAILNHVLFGTLNLLRGKAAVASLSIVTEMGALWRRCLDRTVELAKEVRGRRASRHLGTVLKLEDELRRIEWAARADEDDDVTEARDEMLRAVRSALTGLRRATRDASGAVN